MFEKNENKQKEARVDPIFSQLIQVAIPLELHSSECRKRLAYASLHRLLIMWPSDICDKKSSSRYHKLVEIYYKEAYICHK